MFSLETWCKRDLPHGGVLRRISMCLVVVDWGAEVCAMAWLVQESGGARHMSPLCSELLALEALEEKPCDDLYLLVA